MSRIRAEHRDAPATSPEQLGATSRSQPAADADRSGGVSVVTDEGITISFDLAAVLGSGRLRDLVERDARANGYVLPTQVVAFLSECESVRRAIDAAAGTADTDERYRPVESVSVTTFAAAAGRSPRSVRRSCERGTVDAWRDDRGQWRIDIEEMT